MAPEVVKQTSYTSKADIWSLGCVVIEMLTGDHPHVHLNQMQALFRVNAGSLVGFHVECLLSFVPDWNHVGVSRNTDGHYGRCTKLFEADILAVCTDYLAPVLECFLT